jgi:hypothetical protein
MKEGRIPLQQTAVEMRPQPYSTITISCVAPNIIDPTHVSFLIIALSTVLVLVVVANARLSTSSTMGHSLRLFSIAVTNLCFES